MTVHEPATATHSPDEVPPGPVMVIGRRNDFLYPVPDVGYAVEYTNKYLNHTGMGVRDVDVPQEPTRLRLDELEFFDGLGRRLDPVLDATGALVDLVYRPDHRPEIEDRIRGMLDAARARVPERRPELAARIPELPAAGTGYDDFATAVLKDPTLGFDAVQNCTFLVWLFGRCR